MDGLLNVGIGMMLIYLVGSLTVTAAQEAIASLLSLRGRTLMKALHQLFTEPEWRERVLQHPLLSTLLGGGKRPSYLPPRNIALALTSIITTGKDKDTVATIAEVQAWARANKDSELGRIVAALLLEAQGDLAKFQVAVESWYADAMDRLGGAFKRLSQYIGFGTGLVVAAVLNIDSVGVFGSLLADPTAAAAVRELADGVAASAPPMARELPELMQQLRKSGVPLGWPGGFAWDRVWPALPGWIVSAFALSLGAAFWFDTLQRFVRVRSSGPKPAEPAKAPEPAGK